MFVLIFQRNASSSIIKWFKLGISKHRHLVTVDFLFFVCVLFSRSPLLCENHLSSLFLLEIYSSNVYLSLLGRVCVNRIFFCFYWPARKFYLTTFGSLCWIEDGDGFKVYSCLIIITNFQLSKNYLWSVVRLLIFHFELVLLLPHSGIYREVHKCNSFVCVYNVYIWL